ncbi:MAG: polysaccharide pyruvyl transferase family protein [Alphaproteobacteria bacterium]|nr:polysaccharide pyruvyl transferase family protein [Alphaproteobacteria bacterium]
MHKIALQIVSAFIPNKEKRKAFRKKHKAVDTNKLLNILLETKDNLAYLKTDLSNSLSNITLDLNKLQNEINLLKEDKLNPNSIYYIHPQPSLGSNFSSHKREKKQILILGYYGDYNCGDEIMLKRIIEQTYKQENEISVMFVPSARYNFDQFENNIHIYYPPQTFSDLDKIASFYDELIIGGGAHVDDNTIENLSHIPFIGILLSKKMLSQQKNVRWIGVSTNNELKNKEYIPDLKYIIENCSEFSVRDTYSRTILTNLNITPNKIALTKDLALTISERKTIAVTLINYLDNNKKLIQFINEIIQFCESNPNQYQICFLPFFNSNHHDEKMFKEIISHIDFKGVNYFIAPEYYSPEAMLILIQGCDLFVNMRYHASLLSMNYNKPTISICYDIHPHYWNKIHYIHEQFNNKNIISYKNYQNGELFNHLKKL